LPFEEKLKGYCHWKRFFVDMFVKILINRPCGAFWCVPWGTVLCSFLPVVSFCQGTLKGNVGVFIYGTDDGDFEA
jgi:hypothetical protein